MSILKQLKARKGSVQDQSIPEEPFKLEIKNNKTYLKVESFSKVNNIQEK